MSSVTPGPTDLPGALRRRSSRSRSAPEISRKAVASAAKSISSPSPTLSQAPASSPLT